MAEKYTPKLAPGDQAKYVSGAQGVTTQKIGKVLCIIPGSTSARKTVAAALGVEPESLSKTCLKGQDSSLDDRYAIAIPRTVRKDTVYDYYMPLVTNVDKQMGLRK